MTSLVSSHLRISLRNLRLDLDGITYLAFSSQNQNQIHTHTHRVNDSFERNIYFYESPNFLLFKNKRKKKQLQIAALGLYRMDEKDSSLYNLPYKLA